MLELLGQGIWFADGGIVSFKGFDYPTRMAAVRMADGGLWLWSPVAKTAAIEAEVRSLGPVRHLVSPNKLHYLFLAEWQASFPKQSCGRQQRRSESALIFDSPTLSRMRRPRPGRGKSTNSTSTIRRSWTN